MQSVFKRSIRLIHLWLGLGSGLIVFIVSLTGCLYVFEGEIRALTQKDFLYVSARSKPFAGLETILKSFNRIAPADTIALIRIVEGTPNATVQVSTKTKVIYYFNPYDGSLVHHSAPDWLDFVEEIHISLLLGEEGKLVQRWSVVIFVVMLFTGLVLWFPRNMRLLRQALTIKWKASVKRINYDLHNVLGFYASFILIIISLTGLFFAFKEVKTAAAFIAGAKLSNGKTFDTAKPANSGPVSMRYGEIYRNAKFKYPGAEATSLSVRKNGELRLRMIYPYRWARNQNTFHYVESTGQLLRGKLYKDFNRADLIEATNYDLHTGRLFGFFGKVLAFLASLVAASLPVTGVIIWFKKRKKGSRIPMKKEIQRFNKTAC